MEARTDEREREPLAVRATVHLPGLRPGQSALVDPSDPYIAAALDARHLVPLEGDLA